MNPGVNYQPWQWDYAKFPQKGTNSERISFFIEAGILAASIYNTQPWQFKITDGKLLILPNPSVKLQEADATGRGMVLSLGCVLTNIECAAAYHGYATEISIDSDNSKLQQITVDFKKNQPVNEKLAVLCPFISKRFSNKAPYVSRQLEQNVLVKHSGVKVNGASVSIIIDKSKIDGIAQLHKQAVEKYTGNITFAKELVGWLRPHETSDADGMPMQPNRYEIVTQGLLHDPAVFKRIGGIDQQMLLGSPTVGIVYTNKNTVKDWLAAGQTYEELALNASSLGVSMTPLHAMIEDSLASEKLAQIFGVLGTPQMFFRAGYAKNPPYHTPRKKINEVLTV